MSIHQNSYGAWVISKLVGEGPTATLLTRQYIGYTKREAVENFQREHRMAEIARHF